MSSYGLIPLTGSGPLLQVHPLEDGVLAELLLDPQHGLLNLPLPGMGGLVRLLLLLLGGVVGEQNPSTPINGTSAPGNQPPLDPPGEP